MHKDALMMCIELRESRAAFSILALLLCMSLVACMSSSSDSMPGDRSQTGSPRASLEQLPVANRALFADIEALHDWRNPIVRVGVDSITVEWREGRRDVRQADELYAALSTIPLESWPYGRVVALFTQSIVSAENQRALDARHEAVLAVLAQNRIEVEGWPSS